MILALCVSFIVVLLAVYIVLAYRRRHRLDGVNVAVVGAGAVGSAIAKSFVDGGASVELWYAKSPANADKLRSYSIDGKRYSFKVAETPGETNENSIIFWAVKNYDLDDAAKMYDGWNRNPNAVYLFVENGIWLGSDPAKPFVPEVFSSTLQHRNIASRIVVSSNSTRLLESETKSGEQEIYLTESTKLGIPPAIWGKIAKWPAGFWECRDFQEQLTEKMIINCGINGISVLCGGANENIGGLGKKLSDNIVREAADYLGVSGDKIAGISRRISNVRGRNSMAVDILEGKPTEIANLNGTIHKPFNAWITSMIDSVKLLLA